MPKLGEQRPGRDIEIALHGERFEERQDRRERIMKAYYAGVLPHIIAKREGCSRENIGYIIRKFCTSIRDMKPLPKAESEWLSREAKKHKCSANDMARAILLDAINELMEPIHGKSHARDGGPRDAEHSK